MMRIAAGVLLSAGVCLTVIAAMSMDGGGSVFTLIVLAIVCLMTGVLLLIQNNRITELETDLRTLTDAFTSEPAAEVTLRLNGKDYRAYCEQILGDSCDCEIDYLQENH